MYTKGDFPMKKLMVLVVVLACVLSLVGCNQTEKPNSMEHREFVSPTVPPEEEEYSQLIAAIGINGVNGYVYYSDLYGNQPNTPEEAVQYMENLDAEIAAAKLAGQEFLRYIPLYDADGITIIGEYGISYPD